MQAALNGSFGSRPLDGTVVSIGRAPENQIIISDSQASGHHAELRPDGQGYSIVDKGSTNGTYVNDQLLTAHMPRPLAGGDHIRIGTTVMTYDAESSVAPTIYAAPSFSSAAPSTVRADEPAAGNPYQAYGTPPAYGAGVPPVAPVPPAYPPQTPAYPVAGYPQTPAAYPVRAPYPVQPGAYPPPGGAAGYAPPKKKSRAGLMIGIILAVVIIVGGGLFALVAVVFASTPEKTLTGYCTAIKANDFHTAYSFLSKRAQSKQSEQ